MSKSDIARELEEKEAELGRLRAEAESFDPDSAEGAAARLSADRMLTKVTHLRSELKHAK